MQAPVAGGEIAGRVGTGAAISGGPNVAREMTSERIRVAVARTAEKIAKVLEEALKKRGWRWFEGAPPRESRTSIDRARTRGYRAFRRENNKPRERTGQ